MDVWDYELVVGLVCLGFSERVGVVGIGWVREGVGSVCREG